MGLGATTSLDGHTAINNYAAEGVDESIAISNDNCEHLVCTTGIDKIIDSVSTKADGKNSFISFTVNSDNAKAGERATVAGNLPGSNNIAIVGTTLVKVCLSGVNGAESPT